ncbi:MAG: hypothetical protein IPM61_07270 [Chlorobi bacterium]|nr:hypothetical protein [Chlorobiota bacterium]MCE7935374.1 hypothetical protein [Chlorobi bacterium CHB2]
MARNFNAIANDENVQPGINGLQKKAIAAAAVGVALLVVGAISDADQFYRSYLLGYIYWVLISVGMFTLYALHNTVSGAWGFTIRRFLETGVRTLPLMLVLFVPIIFGMHSLYEWTHADVVAKDHILQQKAPYLNETFFIIRLVFYFALWSGLGFYLIKLNRQIEENRDPKNLGKVQKLSAVTLLLIILTGTFAAVDWMMSLEPHWFSTIYGILFAGSAALSALAVTIGLVVKFRATRPLSNFLAPRIFHDYGTLMFTMTMFWAYISFSQFIIIWSGNVAEETPWYAVRMANEWGTIGWGLVFFHFALPWVILLSKKVKRSPKLLFGVALWMLFMRFVDLFWLIAPAHLRSTFSFHWLDLAAPLAIGGIWLTYYCQQLKGKTLMTVWDPRLEDAWHRIEHADAADAARFEDTPMAKEGIHG